MVCNIRNKADRSNLLTFWNRVLLEKLEIAQLVKEIPTMSLLCLEDGALNQMSPAHIILILCCICLGFPSGIFLSVMLNWIPYAFVIFPMSRSSHHPWFHHLNSVWWRIKTVESQISIVESLPLKFRYSTSTQNKRETRNNYFFFRLSNCYSPILNNIGRMLMELLEER